MQEHDNMNSLQAADANKTLALPQKKRSPGRQICLDLLKGLLFTFVVLGLKLWVEQTTFGKQLQLMTYNMLQLRLLSVQAKTGPPIAVVDITKLKVAPFDLDGRVGEATPRDQLLKLIEAIAGEKPIAIGVDIDFSPNEHGYITPRDPEFFNACMEIKEKTGVPIFLGIARTQSLPPKYWLGADEYEKLAASIMVPKGIVSKMMKWVRADENAQAGPTLSAALANVYQKSERDFLKWLHGLVEQVSEKQLAAGLEAGQFLVDYSILEVIENNRLQTVSPATIADQGHVLSGKMVFVGDGTRHKAQDAFIVPGRQDTIPGVYLHACAAYTLAEAPLYELTHVGRFSIDLALSVAIIIGIASIRLYYKDVSDVSISVRRVQRILTFLVVLAAFIVGMVFVRTTRVMWDDFILVIGALLLHPPIERILEKSFRYLRKDFPGHFVKIISKKDGDTHE